MASAELVTYSDLIDHLVDVQGGAPVDKQLRDIRRAIQSAYRELALAHRWKSLEAVRRFNTSASYSTGTIEYTHSTRTLTLTTGTWPSWAASGHVVIADVAHAVQRRDSDTVLILDPYLNPGANVSSSTSYAIYQATYQLPPDTVAIHTIRDRTGRQLGEITPSAWLNMLRESRSTGEPDFYALIGSPDNTGGLSALVYPLPTALYSYDFVAQRYPRQLKITGLESSHAIGTVAISAGATTVTGTTTAFTSAMEGSIIRVSADSTAPTGLAGAAPYSEQRVISKVSSSTSLTVEDAFVSAYSGTKYLVSDRVDFEQGLLEALYRGMERQLAMVRPEDERRALADELYAKAVEGAKVADARHISPRQATGPLAGVRASYTVTSWRD